MKNKLLTLLIALIASVGTLFAESGTCGENLTWDLTGGVLTISGTGAMTDYTFSDPAPWYANSESFTSVTIGNSVTSIGDYAFYNCTGLTSVEIPNSITSIGDYAFSGCSGLISVAIPNSVTSIGGGAFLRCIGLTSIDVAADNTNYSSVEGVLFNKNQTSLLQYPSGKQSAYTIPNSVTIIRFWAFSGCIGLTSVVIPNSVTSIGVLAFEGCTSLTSVEIPNSVTSIGVSAFADCTSLTSVTNFANTPQEIDANVFDNVDKSACTLNVPAQSLATYQSADVWKDFGNILAIEDTPEPCITASGACGAEGDNLTWTLSCDSVLTISGTGAMADFSSSLDQSWYAYSEAIKSVIIGNGVTSIGRLAFSYCSSLTSVTIGNSVTSIGNVAFAYCSSLTSIDVASDNSNYCSVDGVLFNKDKTKLIQYPASNARTEYTIPNSVTSIGGYAFQDCSSLTSVVIPNSVTSIGNGAFSYCSSLTCINVASDNSNYCSVDGVLFNKDKTTLIQYPGGKQGAYTIPNSVTSIGDYAFSGCTGLTSVEIPNSVISIGSYAFSWCTGLTSVTIPNSVTSIGGGAFAFSSLTSVTIPNSVTSIGGYAFENCTSLTSVVIPNSVTSIGDGAFAYCTGLTSIEIPNSVISIGNSAFSGCSGLTSVVIPNSVTSIGEGAFEYCSGLTFVTIPNSVISIGDWAFAYCSSLTSVEIPNSVTSIRDYAFVGCSGLTAIYVPCGEMERFKQMLNNDRRINDHAPLPYTITINAEHGNVTYPQTMCDDMSLNATPDYGYHFVQWSDGVTDNPRTIELTRDTTFTAEIAIDKTGNCGDDNALIWTYDAETKTLTITGNGTLNSNYYFGIEAPAQMQKLVIGNEVTSIGDSAFYGMSTINHLIIGGSVATIGNYAFAECRNFDDITCYSTTVPVINATTFENVGNKQYIYLYVPEGRERAYHRDEFWSEFDMQINDAETTNIDTNNVTVGASDNTALFTWPITENAATYTLQITKDGELFCTLIFNSLGQLTGIAFAPSRDRSSQMPSATMSVSAMSFTVTGLDAASKYSYRLSVTDEALNEIQAYSGEFATTGYEGEINEGGEPEIVDTDGIEEVLNQQSEIKNQKLMIDGQLFILLEGKIFNAQGARVR